MACARDDGQSVRQAALALLPPSDEIAQCARELWTESGQPQDHDQAIWLEAERRLLATRREPVVIPAWPIRPGRGERRPGSPIFSLTAYRGDL